MAQSFIPLTHSMDLTDDDREPVLNEPISLRQIPQVSIVQKQSIGSISKMNSGELRSVFGQSPIGGFSKPPTNVTITNENGFSSSSSPLLSQKSIQNKPMPGSIMSGTK
jgi:hypothetical protein